ncbi:MAG: ATP-binding protein [Bdellovibrionales bacterium]|nr:ATP-binding protein [Bdellovibrionales bacterium]
MPEELELIITASDGAQQLAAAVERVLALLPEDLAPERIHKTKLGLQEVMQNAYEHGTLGISGSEKSQACETDSFEALCKERASAEPYSERIIQVHAKCAKGLFSCAVTDQGDGFDWRSLKNSAPEHSDLDSLHGRGVLISMNVFDDVIYNARGNAVTVFLEI